MFAALFKTFGQFGDPRFQKVMKGGLIGALVTWIGLVVVIWALASYTALFSIGWLESMIDWGATLAALILSGFLFPAVVQVVTGIFLEDICSAVEDKHYTGLPAPRVQPMNEVIIETIKFALLLAVVNIVALPLYIASIWFAGLGLFLFYAINGYLISREYFDLVAVRRMDAAQAKALRKANMGYLWFGGALCAFGLTVPVVNWFMPIIATAFMVHLFHKLHDVGAATGGTGMTASGGNSLTNT